MAKRRVIILIGYFIFTLFILQISELYPQNNVKNLDLSANKNKIENSKPENYNFVNKQYEEDEDMARKLYQIDSALAGLESIKNISNQNEFKNKLQELRKILTQDSADKGVEIINNWISRDNTGLFAPVYKLLLGGVYHYMEYEYDKAAEIYLNLNRKEIKSLLDPAFQKKNKYVNSIFNFRGTRLYQLAYTYYNEELYDKAYTCFNTIIKDNHYLRLKATSLFFRADILEKQGKIKQAIASLNQVKKLGEKLEADYQKKQKQKQEK